MKILIMIFSLVLLSTSSLVLAHGDAKGIVKERMDLMKDLKAAIKALKPIMRGKETYDVEKVQQNALVFRDHAGSQMTKLFPKGSLDMPSEAKSEIWDEWDNFQRIADDLERFAQALHDSAADTKGRGSNSKKGQHMGGQSMMGGKHHMKGKGMHGGMGNMSDKDLASMPSQGIFRMIGKTCGSCHKQYRVKN